MSYFASHKGKEKVAPKRRLSTQEKDDGPVLNDEDEEFLRRITSQVEGDPPVLPTRPQDLPVTGEPSTSQTTEASQVVLFGSAEDASDKPPPEVAPQDIALPDAPDTPIEEKRRELGDEVGEDKGKGKGHKKAKSSTSKWPSFLRRESKSKGKSGDTGVAREGEEGREKTEAEKEEDEIESVLEQLNFAAVDNRVFSFSKESKQLLRKYDHLHPTPIHVSAMQAC